MALPPGSAASANDSDLEVSQAQSAPANATQHAGSATFEAYPHSRLKSARCWPVAGVTVFTVVGLIFAIHFFESPGLSPSENQQRFRGHSSETSFRHFWAWLGLRVVDQPTFGAKEAPKSKSSGMAVNPQDATSDFTNHNVAEQLPHEGSDSAPFVNANEIDAANEPDIDTLALATASREDAAFSAEIAAPNPKAVPTSVAPKKKVMESPVHSASKDVPQAGEFEGSKDAPEAGATIPVSLFRQPPSSKSADEESPSRPQMSQSAVDSAKTAVRSTRNDSQLPEAKWIIPAKEHMPPKADIEQNGSPEVAISTGTNRDETKSSQLSAPTAQKDDGNNQNSSPEITITSGTHGQDIVVRIAPASGSEHASETKEEKKSELPGVPEKADAAPAHAAESLVGTPSVGSTLVAAAAAGANITTEQNTDTDIAAKESRPNRITVRAGSSKIIVDLGRNQGHGHEEASVNKNATTKQTPETQPQSKLADADETAAKSTATSAKDETSPPQIENVRPAQQKKSAAASKEVSQQVSASQPQPDEHADEGTSITVQSQGQSITIQVQSNLDHHEATPTQFSVESHAISSAPAGENMENALMNASPSSVAQASVVGKELQKSEATIVEAPAAVAQAPSVVGNAPMKPIPSLVVQTPAVGGNVPMEATPSSAQAPAVVGNVPMKTRSSVGKAPAVVGNVSVKTFPSFAAQAPTEGSKLKTKLATETSTNASSAAADTISPQHSTPSTESKVTNATNADFSDRHPRPLSPLLPKAATTGATDTPQAPQAQSIPADAGSSGGKDKITENTFANLAIRAR